MTSHLLLHNDAVFTFPFWILFCQQFVDKKKILSKNVQKSGNSTGREIHQKCFYGNKVKDGRTVCYHKLFFLPKLAKYPVIENGHFWTEINVHFQIYRVSLEFGHILRYIEFRTFIHIYGHFYGHFYGHICECNGVGIFTRQPLFVCIMPWILFLKKGSFRCIICQQLSTD